MIYVDFRQSKTLSGTIREIDAEMRLFTQQRCTRKRVLLRIKRVGLLVEENVRDHLIEASKGTPFQGTIQLVSGKSFPDIVAARYYGVEVKSTKDNKWQSIGSSILESSRLPDVERIYMTFGKLGAPVAFLSRPYEECLSDISVTHYPRYRIDMQLKKGETIFDKMGTPYEQLRKLDNPVPIVSNYYRKRLKSGESLWWAGDDPDISVPMTIKLWSVLPSEERESLAAMGYAYFPEILGPSSPTKYNRFSLWLVTQKGIVNNNVRDAFSAGGKVPLETSGGQSFLMPAAFGRIQARKGIIRQTITSAPKEFLKECWNTKTIQDDRLSQWCGLVAREAYHTIGGQVSRQILEKIFSN